MLRVQRLYKGALVKPAVHTVLVPVPTTTGRMGAPALRDTALLDWCRSLLDAVVGGSVSAAAGVAS